MQVAIEHSEGKFDHEQLAAAYRYFGLQLDGTYTDDDHIIGSFDSRLQDSPLQELEMREQLRIIGTSRRSKKILDHAEDCKTKVANGADCLLMFDSCCVLFTSPRLSQCRGIHS